MGNDYRLTEGYELTDRQRKVHLYVDYVVCDADRRLSLWYDFSKVDGR